jgi:hypothetical protein
MQENLILLQNVLLLYLEIQVSFQYTHKLLKYFFHIFKQKMYCCHIFALVPTSTNPTAHAHTVSTQPFSILSNLGKLRIVAWGCFKRLYSLKGIFGCLLY